MARSCRLLWLVAGSKPSRIRLKMPSSAKTKLRQTLRRRTSTKGTARFVALSKSRLLQQLERAKHPAHRSVLLNGLKAIEREIEDNL